MRSVQTCRFSITSSGKEGGFIAGPLSDEVPSATIAEVNREALKV